ncbi:MAG: hypothetical protein Q7R81_01745 [Candidatus Peregrinibacteria bacterium]|nr:hypothetical protein [Candidatus Peregrinibacteria bacterium]
MTNSLPSPEQMLQVAPHAVLRRIAFSFLLFAAVLAALLALSFYLLLPLFTTVEIAGEERGIAELKAYRSSLQSRITKAEEQRTQLVLPIHDEGYAALKRERRTRYPLLTLRSELLQEASKVVAQNDAVHVSTITYAPAEGSVALTGDVRFVGPRSMTVLAQFVEALNRMPMVASVREPKFTREEDPPLGFHSPFTLTFTLQ